MHVNVNNELIIDYFIACNNLSNINTIYQNGAKMYVILDNKLTFTLTNRTFIPF